MTGMYRLTRTNKLAFLNRRYGYPPKIAITAMEIFFRTVCTLMSNKAYVCTLIRLLTAIYKHSKVIFNVCQATNVHVNETKSGNGFACMDQAEKYAILSFLTRIFTTGVTDTASLNMASSKNDSKQSAHVCDRDSMMTRVLIT
jgi:hypothetical protein